MADRRQPKPEMKRPHASKKHFRHQDYDSSEDDSEIIEMEDLGERHHAGEGRPRKWHGGMESRNRQYDSDDDPQSTGHLSTSNWEFRNEDYRPRLDRRNMGYNNGSRHPSYQYGKRQRIYLPENTETGDMNVARYSGNHSPEAVEMGYGKPYFYHNHGHGNNNRSYPENMEIGYWNRGFLPDEAHRYPEPREVHMDRGFQPPNMPHHHGNHYPSVWNTQIQSNATQYPQTQQVDRSSQQEEEKKPRKVWWYTTCRVFSAILIILNLVSDWLQYSDMNDYLKLVQMKKSLPDKNAKYCISEDTGEGITEQFMYFTIAGTLLALLQLANIIYQIVQNHRLEPDDEIRNYLDERTEVFLVNAFVRIPQNFLLHRLEKNCIECGISWNSKIIKRFLNGLSALLSSVWRYLTNLKVSSGKSKTKCTFSCSELCGKCTECCGDCFKDCFKGCFKCICPCCCCCFE